MFTAEAQSTLSSEKKFLLIIKSEIQSLRTPRLGGGYSENLRVDL